ncbi:TIGR04283 family arsenosugar biosynthesis glycosyltransferase [Cyanobium sp. CH-040]|uniref:TIGR04283 family arsenosugar biosynthesis glycosyltransferase n=1 Tax=Cyanobium sp. CH-040 TaxID=2823708 RepID=UPI0020CCD453|nr:TIGR04283 family arsenosugar biosynthesis glycosyltransferase [Cyanobium sp. CH-040]
MKPAPPAGVSTVPAPSLSIVIPVLNEEAWLGRTLRQLSVLDPPALEVLVVDGGSSDRTTTIAAAAGATVLQAPMAGRAAQMNAGAARARGELLCFLHADTLVPDDLVAVTARVLADPAVAGAGFVSLMAGDTGTRWLISSLNAAKTSLAPLLFRPHLFVRGLRLLFGDQVMVMRRSSFEACGGFNTELPLLEDGDLCLRLVKLGRIRLIQRVVISSDRRVRRWGPWKATALYLWIGVLWGLGVSPRRLRRLYPDVR